MPSSKSKQGKANADSGLAGTIASLESEISQLQQTLKNAKPYATARHAKNPLKDWYALKNDCLADRGRPKVEFNPPAKDRGAMLPNIPGWKPRAPRKEANVLETGLNRTIFLKTRK